MTRSAEAGPGGSVRRRPRLFEWEDQPWLPARLRCWLTDLLRLEVGEVYRPAAPLLEVWLRRCGCTRVIDLCSGSGGPWPVLGPLLRGRGVDVDVTLTDLYPPPRPPDADDGLRWHPGPVDARAVPAELAGCRTMFTALHHFASDEVVKMLRAASGSGVPFAAFEFTAPRIANVAGMLLSPLRVFAETRRLPGLARRFWTYVIPAVPAIYAWDGMVSHLRSYTEAELRALAGKAASDGYVWDVGTAGGAGGLTYLLGRPTGPSGRGKFITSLSGPVRGR